MGAGGPSEDGQVARVADAVSGDEPAAADDDVEVLEPEAGAGGAPGLGRPQKNTPVRFTAHEVLSCTLLRLPPS